MGQIFTWSIISKSVYVVSLMLSFTESFQRSANSSILSPLLMLTASNGIILYWCAGALAAAAGCEGESITLNTGRRVPGRMRSRSSSYVKSRGSVLGAYGLKSRIWPFERSRVRRKSKISGETSLVRWYPGRKCRRFLTIFTRSPFWQDTGTPEILYG